MSKKKDIEPVDVDFDSAYSGCTSHPDKYEMGTADCVYFDVDKRRDGWYYGVVVDSESGHFTETLVKADGPHRTEYDAVTAAKMEAEKWFSDNWNTVVRNVNEIEWSSSLDDFFRKASQRGRGVRGLGSLFGSH
jgi:hypothetical protein